MQSKDILKNALIQYDGTLIIISHDRDFLQGLTNKVFEFRDQNIKEHLGDIYDFLEYRKLKSLQQLEFKNKDKNTDNSAVSKSKLNYERKKQLERDIRKTTNLIKKSELRIEQLEKEIQEKDQILSNPDQQEKIDYDKVSKDYSLLTNELEQEMLHWETLHKKIDSFKNS
jgi:ATP-binding cassette subfamily F protein 3